MPRFNLTVYVTKRPHMRDSNLEYLFMLGYQVLVNIFDSEKEDKTVKSLTLYYPERYMNLVECRSLYQRLEHFCPKLEKVEIWTQCVLILQCTARENIRMIESEDEQRNGTTSEAVTGRLWRDNCHGYDFSKLQVFK